MHRVTKINQSALVAGSNRRADPSGTPPPTCDAAGNCRLQHSTRFLKLRFSLSNGCRLASLPRFRNPKRQRGRVGVPAQVTPSLTRRVTIEPKAQLQNTRSASGSCRWHSALLARSTRQVPSASRLNVRSSRFRFSAAINCLLTAVALLGLCGFGLAAEKPNFIIINVDDLGYAEIGPFGSKTNRTPNLDRMAAEGRKLTSHYAAPVCSPSRASLMTGCYPKRALPIRHVLFPASEVGLHPNEVTIAELLKERGYTTACIGKWHLGDQPGMLPNDQGFDDYYGIPYSNDMGPIQDGAKSNPGQPLPKRQTREPVVAEDGIRRDQPPLPLLRNRTVIERVDAAGQTTITRQYTEQAVRFIRDHRDGPFFLYLPHSAVHFPLYPDMKWRGASQNGLVGDWAQEVDWSVGELLNTVRELGLEQDTMVLFTSDNGGALRHGAHNTPLRGGKGSTLEGGIRVCTIAWWPGQIPAGTSTDAITSTMDVLPTIAGRAGASIPTDRVLDGVDIWPALVGNERPRTVFHYFRRARLEAVRQGPWKLHLKSGELYNLDDDIGEAQDVSQANAQIVTDLRALAAAVDADLGLDDFGPGCRPAGRQPNPQPLISMDGTFRKIQ